MRIIYLALAQAVGVWILGSVT